MKRTLLAAILPVLFLMCLVGCGTSTAATSAPSTTATPGSTSNACQGLATMNRALTSLSNAGGNATVGQLKTIQSGITVAITVVDKVAPASSDSTLSQLKSANDQLGQTLSGLPSSDTLGQHAAQLQQFKDQVAKAQAAAAQLSTKLNCVNPA